jgi:mannose-1-phosphate guanylyltransferase
VGLDEQGRVVRLRAETTAKGEVSGAVFLGIHMVGERLRRELPQRGCLVGDLYLPALRRGDTLRTFDVGDLAWHDIGTPEDYLAANLAWLRARGVPAFVGEGATVGAGVVLEDTVVGRGATVEGEGKVARSVIWPGVRVVAPLVGVVATGP